MTWTKLGQIFEMSRISEDLTTHASNPLAIKVSGTLYRVFFSGRDTFNRSSVGFVDLDISDLTIKTICHDAVVKYGAKSSFYSDGISIGNCYNNDGQNFILFMGWNIPAGQHWRGDIGQIELLSLDNLKIVSEQPFMGVDREDQISLSYPCVLHHEGLYKMWYGSTITWHSENGEMIHVIKYATSKDGKNWEKHGIAVPFELGVAQAFSRPCVVIDNGTYHMWYSYRKGDGTKYRIGYAVSLDGYRWERKDDALGLGISESGWDSEMVCYPFVFEHSGSIYMLYNGNQFGKFGFGIAKLKGKL